MINNLPDAIAHCKDKAQELKTKVEVYKTEPYVSPNLIADCEECAEEHEQLAGWLTELQKRREADRWISVKERLPDKNGNYLVCLNNGGITTDIFDEEELFMGFWGYMTHWRPLPKAPESEETNDI